MNLPTKSEPIALGALVTIILNAALLVLSAFGVASLDGEETAAVYTGANALVVLVVALKTRSVVYSPATVQQAGVEANLEPPHA